MPFFYCWKLIFFSSFLPVWFFLLFFFVIFLFYLPSLYVSYHSVPCDYKCHSKTSYTTKNEKKNLICKCTYHHGERNNVTVCPRSLDPFHMYSKSLYKTNSLKRFSELLKKVKPQISCNLIKISQKNIIRENKNKEKCKKVWNWLPKKPRKHNMCTLGPVFLPLRALIYGTSYGPCK